MDIALIAEKIEAKANKIDENDFTKTYLLPLFKALRYDKVEFYGGFDEKGKDIIAWERDRFESISLTVAQVKYYKPTARAGDKNAFGAVVTQLQQAFEKTVPFTDGKVYLPTTIILVTPYLIDTRALETRFEAINSLRNARIKVLDATDLSKLLDKHLPELANEIVGNQNVCNSVILNTLTNIDLKNALNSPDLREISNIYCDLDFAVGKTTTRLFFSFEFMPQKKLVTVTMDDWQRFAEISKSCEFVFGAKLISEDLSRVEKKFKDILTSNKKINERVNKYQEKIASLGIEEFIDAIIDRGLLERSDDIRDIALEMLKRRNKYNNTEKKESDSYKRYLIDTKNNISQLILNKSKIDSDGLVTLLNNFESVQQDYENLESKIKNELTKRKSEALEIGLDATLLSKKLKEKQSQLHEMLSSLERQDTNIQETSRIVEECFTILSEADTVLTHNTVADFVGISRDQVCRPVSSMDRISVSVHKLFQTRSNFVLYGEAGAGKSTTLQTYARKVINNSPNSVVYYIPLSKAFNSVAMQIIDDVDYGNKLIEVIIKYLASIGIASNMTTIACKLECGNCTLILDGIDEVIEKIPWIIKGIITVNARFPKTQMLLSSRLTGNYIDQIPFFSLTLLPFTDPQRHKFFTLWLNDQSKVLRLEQHLSKNPELNEIVRNPLLATLLCSLADHEAPLPDNEIKIYEERMNLLLGLYDIHKKSVRISSHSSDLWKVARKTAYILHAHEKRHAKKESLLSELYERLDGKIQPEIIRIAFSELIDPCNILVPMTEDGQIGYGHLRFQEYLAACELQSNRGVSPFHFLNKPSWKGALVLFSKMTDDIEDIIAQIAEKDSLTPYVDILSLMLDVRPAKERDALMEIIQRHVELDKIGLHRY
jgi:signal recognition particle GTPase